MSKVKTPGETDVNYDNVIVQLSDRVRIIEDKASLQYVLQERTKAAVENPTPGCYYSKAFFRTRAGAVEVAKRWGFTLAQDVALSFKVMLK